MEFPEFWYESNACWGNVKSLNDLVEKLKLQLADPNNIKTIDDFLDNSCGTIGKESRNFGTRREHNSKYSLRQFLMDHNLLEDFIKQAKKELSLNVITEAATDVESVNNEELREKSLEWFFSKNELERSDLKDKHFNNLPMQHSSQWGYHFTFGQIEEMYKKENKQA